VPPKNAVREAREDGASATDGNRPVLREMIEFIRVGEHAIDAIFVLTM